MSGFMGRVFGGFSSAGSSSAPAPVGPSPVVIPHPAVSDPTPWLTLMQSWIGQATVTGAAPTVFDRMIFSHTSFGPLGNVMESGCAAGVSACLELSGFKSKHSARALDYVGFGEDLKGKPKPGAVCVWDFGGGDHHVDLCSDPAKNEFLGTNQSHTTKISVYDPKYLIYVGWPVEKA